MNEHRKVPLCRVYSRILIEDSESPEILPTAPIVGYAQEPLLSLADACVPLEDIVHDIFNYAATAFDSTSDVPADGLTRDESASIYLYTMEWNDGNRSLYSILNNTLKTADRKDLRPWFKYLKLFLTALVKIPYTPPQTVWRGIRQSRSDEFPQGAQVTWWAFSSTTKSLSVLENDLYLGKIGDRTLFSIETFNGRNIRAHSYFDTEEEILLLPGTYMEVQSQLTPAPALGIIHLIQKIPEHMLLEPPFKGILNTFKDLFLL
jgi:hypothetical protein